MSDRNRAKPRVLLWLIIILMLPVVSLPVLLSRSPDEFSTLLWFYPVYVIGSGYLAYQCYAERREMTYILLVLMVLSHVAVWLLPYSI